MKYIWLVFGAVGVGLLSFFIANDFVFLTQTENGLVLGKPAYEKRSAAVFDSDLNVIREAQSLLDAEINWSKDGTRECNGENPYSLFCALEVASIRATGEYVHRRPALQEVRFAIDDQFKDRWEVHRLAEFNSHPDTEYSDVLAVLATAHRRIEQKLGSQSSGDQP
jgi:hypothetical protein